MIGISKAFLLFCFREKKAPQKVLLRLVQPLVAKSATHPDNVVVLRQVLPLMAKSETYPDGASATETGAASDG